MPSREPTDWHQFYRDARRADGYAQFLGLLRRRKRLLQDGTPSHARTVRLAILSSATTETLVAPLQLAIECHGLGCEIYAASFGTYTAEMMNASPPLLEFAPDITLVATTAMALPMVPDSFEDLQTAQEFAEQVALHWLELWKLYHAQTGSDIILDNFHSMPHSSLGNHAAKLPCSRNNFIARVNLALADNAPASVHIHDVSALSSYLGVKNWHDQRYWFHAKQAVSFDCLLPYVRSLAGIVAAVCGRSLKCLVLDLDNTLWGGVVGDDGVDGLQIGEGDAAGEAFKCFQTYLLELKNRGILLAVCSKNQEENALAPFLEHEEMVLKREDFAVFVANWNPKPDNIRAIAQELNIGMDAIGFVDDNPVEREIVRSWTPEVTVFEMSEDPSQYPRILQDSGMLETVVVSAEDRSKTANYRQNNQRQELLTTTGDYNAYLQSLEQQAVVAPIGYSELARVTQLVNKSNQFNLTTLRASRSQIEAILSDEQFETFTVRLSDRFGDNGLIAVCWGHYESDEFHIDQWLMSCRVLKRGVESLMCNRILKRCRPGTSQVIGFYVPTAKNRLVERHYEELGFRLRQRGDDGKVTWEMDTSQYQSKGVPIQVVDEFCPSVPQSK